MIGHAPWWVAVILLPAVLIADCFLACEYVRGSTKGGKAAEAARTLEEAR